MNRFPPFSAPLLLGVSMMACSGFEDFPPEIQPLWIECPLCPEAGIDTIELHDGPDIRKVAIRRYGSGETQADGWEVEDRRIWLSADGIPLEVYDWDDFGDHEFVLRAQPVDWGPTPLLDTLVTGQVRDLSPQLLHWESGFSDLNPFGARMSTRFRIQPDSTGRFALSLPRIYARTYPQRRTSILHTVLYRGAPFRSDSLPGSVLSPAWPPPVDTPALPPVLVEHQPDGTILHVLVYRRLDSTWGFLRTHTLDGMRVREDSGNWNRSTGHAEFLVRAPGLAERRDTSTFLPRPILFEHQGGLEGFEDSDTSFSRYIRGTWWRDGFPRLNSAMQAKWNMPQTRYFR